ncbi:MAG TPA: MFS transporter [Spirochaetota bacterium]|nr:MFS transporter [Spirochaetota bacterium]
MKWIIFIVLSFAYILVFFHRFCAGVVAPDMMVELKSGGTLIGLLGALYFYPYAIMQIPAGVLSDTLGPRKTITIFFLISVIGSFVMGFSYNIWTALIGRTLVGIGVSMLFVPSMKIFTKWFSVKEFALITGFFIAFGSIGTLFATSPLAWLSSIIGWRNVFVIISFVTLLITILVWIFVKDEPDKLEYHTKKDILKVEIYQILKSIKSIVKNQYFWFLAVSFFSVFGVFFTITGLWGVPYLMHIYGLSKIKAGGIVSLFAFGMFIGNPLFGLLSEKVFKSRKKLIILISCFNLLIIFFLWLKIEQLSIVALYVIFFCFGLFSNSIASIGFTTNKELFPVKISGTATGFINLFPYLSAAIFQQIFGLVLEINGKKDGVFTATGYKAGFFILLILSLFGIISSFFLKETYGKQHN